MLPRQHVTLMASSGRHLDKADPTSSNIPWCAKPISRISCNTETTCWPNVPHAFENRDSHGQSSNQRRSSRVGGSTPGLRLRSHCHSGVLRASILRMIRQIRGLPFANQASIWIAPISGKWGREHCHKFVPAMKWVIAKLKQCICLFEDHSFLGHVISGNHPRPQKKSTASSIYWHYCFVESLLFYVVSKIMLGRVKSSWQCWELGYSPIISLIEGPQA